MKYIITEEQLSLLRESKIGERVQKAILNLYNKNLSFQNISRIVGVDLETVILTLQDEEIFDENDCNKMYNILYNVYAFAIKPKRFSSSFNFNTWWNWTSLF